MPLRTEWLRLDQRSADAVSPEDGDIWYNDSDGKHRRRENGATVSIGVAPALLAEATGTSTTTSATDVLMDSMTLTPPAGTYIVWFSGSVYGSTGSVTVSLSIYVDGAQEASSERFHVGSDFASFCAMALVTVNGSKAMEGRWNTSSGTATTDDRTLILQEVI